MLNKKSSATPPADRLVYSHWMKF